MILTAFLRLSGIIFCLFHFKYQALAASERQKRDLEGEEKIRRAPLILSYVSGSQTPFIVSICFFSDKALGRCRTEKNIPHIYDSAPDMKNALHFQSCPNLCTGNFQFSVMGRMGDSSRFCHPSFINIKKWRSESGRFLYV